MTTIITILAPQNVKGLLGNFPRRKQDKSNILKKSRNKTMQGNKPGSRYPRILSYPVVKGSYTHRHPTKNRL